MSDERFWEDCADAASKYIEDMADSREIRDGLMLDLRRNYLDEMSRDRWRTRGFDQVVNAIVKAYDEVDRKHGRNGDREEDIIKRTVEIIVDGHFAQLVLENREIERRLDDRVYNEMRDALEEAQDMSDGGRSRSRDSDRDSRRSRDDRDRDRRDDRSSGDRYNTRRSRSRDSGGGGDDHWSAVGDRDERDDRREYDHRDSDRERDRDEDRRERPPREERKADPAPSIHDVLPVYHTPPDVRIQGYDFTKANPYEDFWSNNDHWQIANRSKLKLTGDDLLDRIPAVYDVNTHIKYFVLNESGEVREELVEVTDENRHLAHQLLEEARDPGASPRVLTSRVSLKSRGDGVADELIEKANPAQRLGDVLASIPDSQLSLTSSDTIDSMQGAIFESQVKLLDSGDRARIDLHILRTPVLLRSDNQLSLIDQVHAASTLTEASTLLVELRPQFEKPLWETLNRRFSNEVIRATTFQFQFEITKLNFSTAFGKLLSAFRDTRGAEETVDFAKRMTFVSDLACGHLDPTEVPELAADLLGDKTNVNAAVFVDFCAIATLDYTIDEIGIGLQLVTSNTGMAVTPQTNYGLHQQLAKLFSRLEAVLPPPQKARLMLSTTDNRLIEVLPYAARKDAFILAAVAV